MMLTDAVRFEAKGAIGVITLDRPDNRNSMTEELLSAFEARVTEARGYPDVRCVILTGAGNCFSAGADFRAQIQRGAPDASPAERSYAMYEPFLSILDLEVPVIAAMNGHAVGGGFGLSLLCDIRIVNREAKVGANFARLGLAPGLAVSYLLPRIVGASRAAEMLFSGRLIRGEQAAQIGLASEAVEPHLVMARSLVLAEDIAAAAPLAVRAAKKLLRAGLGWDVRAAARAEAPVQADTLGSRDAREGMAALLEKRDPVFHGR